MKKFNVSLLIFVLSFVLRIVDISGNPPSLTWDEVSIGYNAYSILRTAKDEHGKFLPFDTFTAYGDYKPPLAIYLTVPSIAIFGLNAFAVRFPSALFGSLTILVFYYLVRELIPRLRKNVPGGAYLPSLASLLLSISPWHINLSRAGFEANIALFFVTLGTYLILKTRNNRTIWIISFIPYVLSVYTFNSARYFVVIFSFGLLLYCINTIRQFWKQWILGVCIALILLLPIVGHLLSKEARLRFIEVNIFSDIKIVETANERLTRSKDFINTLANNRRVGYTRSYLIHFFDNLEPEFLFISGDGNPKFSIRDVGQLYCIEAPFFIIGFLGIFVFDWKIGLLLLYWVISAIIPAATARETPHALRILNLLPVFYLWIAFGQLIVFNFIRKTIKKLSIPYVCLLIFLYVFCVTYYLHNYYRHYPIEFSGEWQYGYEPALEYVKNNENRYKSVVLTESIGRAYMYTAFYLQTDPTIFRQQKNSYFDAAGFYHVMGYGKYLFSSSLPTSISPNTLYIWDIQSVPKGVRILKTITLLNGTPILAIFDKI